jgi:hypothetical protein
MVSNSKTWTTAAQWAEGAELMPEGAGALLFEAAFEGNTDTNTEGNTEDRSSDGIENPNGASSVYESGVWTNPSTSTDNHESTSSEQTPANEASETGNG